MRRILLVIGLLLPFIVNAQPPRTESSGTEKLKDVITTPGSLSLTKSSVSGTDSRVVTKVIVYIDHEENALGLGGDYDYRVYFEGIDIEDKDGSTYTLDFHGNISYHSGDNESFRDKFYYTIEGIYDVGFANATITVKDGQKHTSARLHRVQSTKHIQTSISFDFLTKLKTSIFEMNIFRSL
jgi:hypothetical protein